MRLPRTSLLGRLTAPDVPPVVLLEAPPGYGKSWLARRAADGDVLRLRGELGPLATGTAATAGHVAHRRRPPAVPRRRRSRCVERIEDADGDVPPDRRRAHPRRRHARGHAARRRADHRRRRARRSSRRRSSTCSRPARRRWPTGSSTPPTAASASSPRRSTRADATRRPTRSPSPRAWSASPARPRCTTSTPASTPVVALLARAPGIDRHLLDRLGGAGFVDARGRRRRPAAAPDHRRARARRGGGAPRHADRSRDARPSSPTTAASGVAPSRPSALLLDAGGHERATQHDRWASASRSPTPSSPGRC